MILKVRKIEEMGFQTAMLALSKNKKQPVENMRELAHKLKNKNPSHAKFLRFMKVSFEVECPMHWNIQLQTYKIGTTCSSSSIMHTLVKELLENNDCSYLFEKKISDEKMIELRMYAKRNDIVSLKQEVPPSFIYSIVWDCNYAVLRNIIIDRAPHRLPHWQEFIHQIYEQVDYPEFLN